MQNTDSKKTVKINESFTCLKCGHLNPPADRTCRNHCRKCLYSLHVDELLPGDRSSVCMGLMEPIKIDFNSKKGYLIHHLCLKCGKKIVNKASDDDEIDSMIATMHKQNLGY